MKTKLVILVALVSIGYLQWQRSELAVTERLNRSEIDALMQERTAQMVRNAQLKDRLELIKNNSDEVFEGLARQKLFMIKPDEIYVLPLAEE